MTVLVLGGGLFALFALVIASDSPAHSTIWAINLCLCTRAHVLVGNVRCHCWCAGSVHVGAVAGMLACRRWDGRWLRIAFVIEVRLVCAWLCGTAGCLTSWRCCQRLCQVTVAAWVLCVYFLITSSPSASECPLRGSPASIVNAVAGSGLLELCSRA